MTIAALTRALDAAGVKFNERGSAWCEAQNKVLKKPGRGPGISLTDLKRIESRFRRTLGCMTLAVDPPATRNASPRSVSGVTWSGRSIKSTKRGNGSGP